MQICASYEVTTALMALPHQSFMSYRKCCANSQDIVQHYWQQIVLLCLHICFIPKKKKLYATPQTKPPWTVKLLVVVIHRVNHLSSYEAKTQTFRSEDLASLGFTTHLINLLLTKSLLTNASCIQVVYAQTGNQCLQLQLATSIS